MSARDERRAHQRIAGAEQGYDGSRLSERREGRDGRGKKSIRMLIILLVMVAVLLVAALVAFLVLSGTGAFAIASIDTEDTEHLTAENIGKLANVPEGTTLLSMDEDVITENLKRNPWVGSVSYVREFPDRLKIIVTERTIDCLVKMGTGSVCWCLGDDGVWIEPLNLTVSDGNSSDDEALGMAQRLGATLITDVPTSVSPSAGSAANDEIFKAVAAYRELLSEEFSSQIVRFSVPSVESLSCTLKSGVEVSLGGPTNIDIKEAVVLQILERHPNQVTYINVRVPSQPSYRKLGVETVTEGTGVSVETTPDPGLNDQANPTTGAPEAGTGEGENGTVPQDGTGTGTDQTTDANGDGTTPTGEGTADPNAPTDTSEMILGEDGNYYTYEQYWGLDG